MTSILTPSQTSGPLFGFALFPVPLNSSVDPNDPAALVIEGQITDGENMPVIWEAFVEIWAEGQACRSRTDENGRFHVIMRKPLASHLSDGRLLAPHLNVAVFARGLARQFLTRVYFPEEEARNAADPVLELVDPVRRHTLIGKSSGGGKMTFDICLQGGNETIFFSV